MKIEYQKYELSLSFDSPISSNVPLTYLLRSVIGKELKFISCVLQNQICPTCPLSHKCAYSVIFDNPILKDNQILAGRKNSTPPYILSSDVVFCKKTLLAKITLTLVGKGIKYFSYILLALVRAGKIGVLKDRTNFNIGQINIEGKNYLPSSNFTKIQNQIYVFNGSNSKVNKSFILKLDSPFRYKFKGEYISDITLQSILSACERRLNILSGFYGDKNIVKADYANITALEVEQNLTWIDVEHYSARQHTAMQLGGVVGNISVSGEIEESVLSLLKGGSLFNIGKSVSFGLGKLDVMELI